MTNKREKQRHIKKLPIEVCSGDITLRGTTVKLSEKGIFVRSQKNFQEGVPVDLTIHLTEERSCSLKGIVKYVRNIDLLRPKNGMGIELTANDQRYIDFVRSVEKESR
jgi:Tfp pilus assembly protein PilZ